MTPKEERHSSNKKDDAIQIPVGKYLRYVRRNPWVLASVVLAIILIIVLTIKVGNGAPGATVSKETAGERLVSFINAQGDGTAQLVSSEQEGALYKVTVNYQGQDIPAYVTLDGKYLIAQPIPLDDETNVQVGTGEPVEIPIGSSPVLGNANASVTVVEFSDFSCPFCGAASGFAQGPVSSLKARSPDWEPAVPELIKEYVNSGNVKFVFKYFPGHGTGEPAQLVGWCLNDQKLFWKFHDRAFAEQEQTNNITRMKELAKAVGATMSTLNNCLDSKKYDSLLEEETTLGRSIGVQGTPAFFVDGVEVPGGAIPYSTLRTAVEAALAGDAS